MLVYGLKKEIEAYASKQFLPIIDIILELRFLLGLIYVIVYSYLNFHRPSSLWFC